MILRVFALFLVVAILTACASAGPQVMVLPGKNKTLDQFHTDDSACRGWAAQQSEDVSGWRYDMAYLQCMYAKGHQIPVSGGPQPTYKSQSDVPNMPESAPPVPPSGPPR